MPKYSNLAISDPRQLVFGVAPHPVTTRRGLVIGGGEVYPELNFTLPPMEMTSATLEHVKTQYRATKAAALKALELIEKAHSSGTLTIPEMEVSWIVMLGDTLSALPANRDAFISQVLPTLDESKFLKEEYLL